MKKDYLRCTLRVDGMLLKKFRYLAELQGRSVNREIEQYLKKCVAHFEEQNGTINFDDSD